MTYLPTQEDLALLTSHSKSLFTRIELLNKTSQIIDSIEGLTLDGAGAIDADSDIRRTYNLSIFPKKGFSISKFEAEDWIDKKVRIYIGMKAPTSEKDANVFHYDGELTTAKLNAIVQNDTAYSSKNKELQNYIVKIKATKKSVYGNIDNINRPRIIWTARNLNIYDSFSKENGPFEIGDYSTACGCDDAWTADNEAVGVTVTRRIAYTLFLENSGELIPVSRNGVMNYISEIYKLAYEKIYNNKDNESLDWTNNIVGAIAGSLGFLIGSKLWTKKDIAFSEAVMSYDSIGLSCTVDGKAMFLKNMIAAVEGCTIGDKMVEAADVAAIAG